MKTRLIKNWLTILFGLITFAVATSLLQKGTITLESFIAAMPTVALLFGAKDSLLWLKPKEWCFSVVYFVPANIQ